MGKAETKEWWLAGSRIDAEFPLRAIVLRERSTRAFSIIMCSGLEEGEILPCERCQEIQWEVAEEGRAQGNKMAADIKIAADIMVFLECFTTYPGVFAA